MMWSAASVAGLLFFLALILYFQHRYSLTAQDVPNPRFRFDLAAAPLTPSQRATAKYFVIALALFLVQCLLGGKMAHDYADGASFFGFNLSQYLPFNIARTWHLQLAIFWIATAWLGMGIFIAPLVSGREPKGQRALVNILFGALVVVVVGSLAGEYLSIKGMLGKTWWWLGTQGWEYLELGRLWMLLLIAGMGIWLFIVARGLRAALKAESDRGGLTHLLLYSAAAIPVFYCFALFVNRDSHITMADYWRWWLIHLWVEGMFEVFAVVVIGFLMVRLGLVTAHSTLRATYFQLIILLGSGIIGTGHHYYWIGAPEAWMALGAIFSALEVIPLSLLMVEAYGQYKVIRAGGVGVPVRGIVLVPGGHRLLEPVRRGRAGLPDQPAVRELLPARVVPDGGPRARRADGRLRNAGHRAGAVLAAQHRGAALLEGEMADGQLLGPEHRADGWVRMAPDTVFIAIGVMPPGRSGGLRPVPPASVAGARAGEAERVKTLVSVG